MDATDKSMIDHIVKVIKDGWYDPMSKDLGTTTFDICPRCSERIKAEMNDVRIRNRLNPIPCNMQKLDGEF